MHLQVLCCAYLVTQMGARTTTLIQLRHAQRSVLAHSPVPLVQQMLIAMRPHHAHHVIQAATLLVVSSKLTRIVPLAHRARSLQS